LKIGETPRQAGMLFSSNIASMFFSFLVTAVQLRWMDPADRGRFALALTIVSLSALAFEFGAFPAGARILALASDPETESRSLGALVLTGLGLGVVMAGFLLLAAQSIDAVFKKEIRWVLVAAAPLSISLLLQSLVQSACQGLNRIARLSLFQLSQSALNLTLHASLAFAGRLTAMTALAAQLSAIGIASLWTIIRMRPAFRETSRHLKMTFEEVRRYGFNIYLARITGTTSLHIDNLIIGYYIADPVPLSLYDATQKLSNPIVTVARSVAISRFRAFAAVDRVPRRISAWNLAILLASSAALAAIGPFALPVVFPKYAEAAPLLIPFAMWGLFGGLFQPYNMFLNAHGRGAEIRNIAMATMLASITSLVVCVPRWGIAGAAWASAATMALDYGVTLYYYQKFRKKISSAPSESK
jgi:O-antigen/teichoic acid export membrane protein